MAQRRHSHDATLPAKSCFSLLQTAEMPLEQQLSLKSRFLLLVSAGLTNFYLWVLQTSHFQRTERHPTPPTSKSPREGDGGWCKPSTSSPNMKPLFKWNHLFSWSLQLWLGLDTADASPWRGFSDSELQPSVPQWGVQSCVKVAKLIRQSCFIKAELLLPNRLGADKKT